MEDVKDSKLRRFCSKNILIILGFSSIMAVIALIAVGLTQNKPLPENIKYGIVLDAGSSHTTLYIYKWPGEKENDTGVVNQLEECKVKGQRASANTPLTSRVPESSVAERKAPMAGLLSTICWENSLRNRGGST
uniref:Ectonucleoside triphosphate diphosphohydrolase 1 n=1 Tax=Rousettus aegyptiacus TaxID=9407 RepID=A0A7J8G6W1_ROUAE|nr:ectonucleoside triphosphate diphosphohydrolase 1 [Rousettus aegyptiacus]